MNRISRVLLTILFLATIAAAQTKPADDGWPRRFTVGSSSVAIYQPQIEDWSGNSLSARAALSITEAQGKQPLYGVLWFSARAEIDKVNRLVTLSDFQIKKLNLPMAPDKAAAFEAALQTRADKQVNVIALESKARTSSTSQTPTTISSFTRPRRPITSCFQDAGLRRNRCSAHGST